MANYVGIKMDSQYHRLFRAAQTGDFRTVKRDIEANSRVAPAQGDPRYLKDASLIIAAANGHAAIVRYLVDQGVSQAAARDARLYAEENGYQYIAKELLPPSPRRNERNPELKAHPRDRIELYEIPARPQAPRQREPWD